MSYYIDGIENMYFITISCSLNRFISINLYCAYMFHNAVPRSSLTAPSGA